MVQSFRRVLQFVAMAAGAAWALAGSSASADSDVPSLARPSAQPRDVVIKWLAQNTSIAPASVVSVGDQYIVAVLSSRSLDPSRPRVLRLEIRAEMTDPDSTTANLLRSLSATLDLDCASHTSHFVEVRTFSRPNLAGKEEITHPQEGWAPNPRGSYFEDIDKAVCDPQAPRPLMVASANPTPRPQRSEPELSAPLRPELGPDEPAAAHRAPPTRAAPDHLDRARSEAAVQIAAAASQVKAEAALAGLKAAQPALTAGLSTRVERIERGGVTYYRALISGFAPPMTAAAFCRRLTAAGRACIVR